MAFTCDQVIDMLRSRAVPKALDEMKRVGIPTHNALGLSLPALHALAKEIGKDHNLAGELWDVSIHEAPLLASLVDDPTLVTEEQMERWVLGFDSWDTCDVVTELFALTPFARAKAIEWSSREEEFVKRAGFVIMAELAYYDKRSGDEYFESFFPLMIREASDDRKYVMKAVNWALRNLGKRNLTLNTRAIEVAQQIRQLDSRSARWIASDALRELTSEKVQKRVSR